MRKFLVMFLAMALFSAQAYAFPNFPSKASGHIVMEFDLSHYNVSKDVKLWVPYPISNKLQTISNIKISGNFDEYGFYSDNNYSTPILFAKWNKKGKVKRVLTISFDAERKEAKKKDFPKKETCWDPSDYKRWLEPFSLGPINKDIKNLALKITEGKVTVYDKAKAIYDWICENMYRDPKVKGCGFGNVPYLLFKHRGGKCTDIHSVFVTLCRAAGVPAREIFGIRMGRDGKKTDITKWQHCYAEFYLPGYGWVPVDPADVLKMMLKRKLTLKDEETQKWREYFWGAWDPYRIDLARGRDIVLNPRQNGAPLNNFGYPYAEIDGKAIDGLDPSNFKYSFTFYPINK